LLVNLTSLSLFRNQIINIKALSKLAKLTTLY
jgi:Leucine-rich repeat (LRR) protein